MGINSISWGIIGCGDVTEVKSGPAFKKVNNSRLHAVMRRNAEKARDYAQRHQVPVWYDDADSLINDPEVNAIYVATPPSTHEKYTITALDAGKPVYVEKPMSTDAASARRMMQAAGKSGSKLSIAHYRRQLPVFLKIKELIDKKAVGDIREILIRYSQPLRAKGFEPREGNWRIDPAVSGGGIFHDLSPHQLDLMLYFFGNPTKVQGTSANRGGNYDADDYVSGNILFSNNVSLQGEWDFNSPEDDTIDLCEIMGTTGKISFSFFTMKEVSVEKNGKIEKITFETLPHVQQPMISKVVEYFLSHAGNPCSAEDGVAVMDMIDAFTKASPIKLPA
jgi:predicted dehydrogenase